MVRQIRIRRFLVASGNGNGVPFRSFSVLIVEVSMVKSDRKSDPVQSTKTPSSQIPQERKICSIRSWKIGNFNIIYLFFRLFNITVCSRKQKRTSCSPPKGQRILNGPDRRGSGPFIETDARFEVIISEPGANDWTEEDVGDEGSNISPLLMVDATKTVGRYLIFFYSLSILFRARSKITSRSSSYFHAHFFQLF